VGDRIRHALEKGTDAIALACGWWLLALTALTCIEIVGRKFFSFSLQGVNELGGYTLAVGSALCFGYALVRRAHTRIDFVVSRTPPFVQAALNAFALLSLTGMAAFAAWRGFGIVAQSVEMQATSSSPLQTPLWLPQSLWLLGWTVFAAIALFQAIDACRLLAGDRVLLNQRYGPTTLQEEIEAETSGLHAVPEAKS
jgi:TRAP-type C4-dicarboxylate transport system permease small subunit